MLKTRVALLALTAALAIPSSSSADPGSGKGKGQGAFGGTYTFKLTAIANPGASDAVGTRQDIARVGTLAFGPNGTVSGHSIATTDDGTTPVVIDFTWSGTYTLNADRTGTLDISTLVVTDASCTPVQGSGVCASYVAPETYAFVFNRHGEDKTLSLIQTDSASGGPRYYLAGEAERQ